MMMARRDEGQLFFRVLIAKKTVSFADNERVVCDCYFINLLPIGDLKISLQSSGIVFILIDSIEEVAFPKWYFN